MRPAKVLVTGVTGTLGSVVTRLLLEQGYHVIGYSRDEQKQRLVPQHERLTLYLGDVRDRDRLLEASRDVDLIIHTAALKCVDTLEANPEESVTTNILGTQNVLHAQRANGIDRVVLVSTDKAAYPVNVYGACKLVAERLVMRNPRNAVCRYGNVVGSRGSVIPTFVRMLRAGEQLPITDERMTRFWIRIEDAAHFVVKTALNPMARGLHVPPMKAAKLSQVIHALAMEIGMPECQVTHVGCRPGEKLHECLETEFEREGGALTSDTAPQYTSEELRKLVRVAVNEAHR